jgi:hypothetical protein
MLAYLFWQRLYSTTSGAGARRCILTLLEERQQAAVL